MNDWSEDIEKVLDQIRMNCVILAKEHKKQYFHLNHILLYFRLPLIIISGINSIVSVGLQPYLNQGTISMMTCLLALTCSIIGSIELYLAIQKSMENELLASKDYYILSIDLPKTLTLSNQHRPIPAKEYLEKKYNEYVKLCENSNLLSKKIIDSLNPLPNTPFYSTKITPSKYTLANISDEESSIGPPQSPSSIFDDDITQFLTSKVQANPIVKELKSLEYISSTIKTPFENKAVEKIQELPLEIIENKAVEKIQELPLESIDNKVVEKIQEKSD